NQPGIVLIDAVLLGKVPEAALEKLRTHSPEIQRVLLVDDAQLVNWVPHYAEAIVIKGMAASAVAEIVSNLLLAKGDEDERNHANP
ncbi:MAG TPA: hypothetical protein VK880_09930, partial [Anaerolineales bacterium]|nr:hypothetical protein [Anaerolineales bacterium]